MKKIISFSILLFFVFHSVSGQEKMPGNGLDSLQNTTGGKGKIAGIIVDSASGLPVEFVTLALIRTSDNKAIDGTLTDDKGRFTLSKTPSGTFKLSIVFIGYKNKDILLDIDEKKEIHDLGKIDLSSLEQTTQEVLVEGKRVLIEEKVDRIVYNAENDATNKGGDATDVLRKAPMLSVDMDGNLSLRGSGNVRVLINNKPSTIMATNLADALKQIPADQIKSVEVITSPSAKYDAEGSAGIVNIILKKNNLEGFSLGVDASGGIRGSSFGINGSYKKGRMGFSLGGHGRLGYNIPGNFENNQLTTSKTGQQIRNKQEARTQNNMAFGSYVLGWDYDINKNNSINASVKYSLRNMINLQHDLYTRTYINDTLSSVNRREVEAKDLSNTVDASLTYTHLFSKPQREFSLLTLLSRNSRNNSFNNDIYNDNSTLASPNTITNTNKSYNQEVTVQADYQEPIGKSQLVEVGAKNIMRTVSSEYQTNKTFNGSPNAVSPGLSNVFNYNQNITAGYATYTLSFLKTYSLKAGARYEYTNINANYENAVVSNVNIPGYNVFVPSLNISKKVSKTSTIKASYNRRIQRPSLQFLNPNTQASNPLNATVGNPYLSPEYTNNYELSFSTFTKIGSFSLASFMRNTTGAIQSVRDVYGDTIRTTYQNIGEENAYGFNLFANINVSKKFTLNGGADVYYAVLKNNVPDPLYNASNQGWVASGRISGSYELTRGWGLQLFSFYRGRQVQLQGYQGGFGIYSLSLKKDFNNKKGSIGFGAENFFTPSFKIRNELHSPVIQQNTVTTLHNMNFKINLSYRIGKVSGDEKRKRRKTINNDDLKDGGDTNPGAGGAGAPATQSTGAGSGAPGGGGRPSNPQNGSNVPATPPSNPSGVPPAK
ncbi:MAG: TonB-dependent receptor [Opitutaceae bacterium]|nr:TonB-dependent receptor [Cytophagales bacterium]